MVTVHLSIEDRASVGRAAWNAVADASAEAWLWHRDEFLDAVATWPGRVDCSFGIRRAADGRLVAVVPMQRVFGRRSALLQLGQLESMGFVACVPSLQPGERAHVRTAAVEHMRRTAHRTGDLEIHASLAPLAPAYRALRGPRVNPLLESGFENTLTQTWMIDLAPAMESIRAAYSSSTRYEMRRARSGGASLREARSPADLDTYYDLHCRTYHRTGAPPRPRAYFEHIFEHFVSQGLSRIMFYMDESRVVAAQNTAMYKAGALYWTGASAPDRVGANRVLLDEQILHAKERGCECYDVGEAFPGASGKKRGLSDFKRSFGGELYPLYRGRVVTRPWAAALLNAARSWRR